MDLLRLHLLGLVLTAVITAVTAHWIRRQTEDRAGLLMTVLLGTQVLLSTLVALQLLAPTQTLMEVFSLLWFSIILADPIVLLVFAIYFTGREFWLTKSVWVVLVLFAAVPVSIVLTEPMHGLLFLNPDIAPDPFPRLVVEWTPFGMVLSVLSNVPILLAFGLLFHMHLFSRRTAWWQSGALILGLFFILVPALLSLTEFVPVRGYPYGVYGAGVFGVIVSFGLFRRNLFGVVPLARNEMVSSLDDAVLVVDAERRIADFNGTADELFDGLGLRVGDPLDDVIPALVGPDEHSTDCSTAVPATAVTMDRSDTGPFAPTLDLPGSAGVRSLRVHVSEIASGGEPRGYVLVLRDVTELERYAADLEQKTEQLEQFASVLSHDLRNPVNVAMGRIELEKRDGDSEHLRAAMDALDRIEATIGDLLTLARSGRTVEDLTAVRLQRVVEDAWETSDTGTATLSVALDEDYRIRADRSRLRTLLENVFRNAVDHGGSTVSVGSLDSGFFVADDGPGIPADDRETVFEYGYTTDDEGTGFGLAIVESVADVHGWTVAVTETDPVDLPEGATDDPDGLVGARFEIRDVDVVTGATDSGSSTPDR